MRFKPIYLVCLFTLVSILVFPLSSAFGEALSFSPTTYAFKVVDVRTGTPSASLLGWSFNGYIQNATYSNPSAILNVTEKLSADSNSTVSAGTITTPLSNEYADDTNAYSVPALNESANLYWIARWDENITLLNVHYIDPSWVKAISITIKGNASITPDTRANVYIYNFTGASWIDMGTALNSTTEATLTYNVASDQIANVINSNDGAIMLEFYFYDSTNTAFTVDIYYLEVDVVLEPTITLSNWSVSQNEISVPYAGGRVYNYTETFTTGISQPAFNLTMYAITPNTPLIKQLLVDISNAKAYLNNTSVNVASDFSINIPYTYTQNGVVKLNYQLPKVYFKDADGLALSNVAFKGGVNEISFNADGTGSHTIQIYITSEPYGVYIDHARYGTWAYDPDTHILSITYDFGSTHYFEIYQYNPSPPLAVAPSQPTPQPQPTQQAIPKPTIYQIIGKYIIYLMLMLLVIIALALYVYRCALLGICKK